MKNLYSKNIIFLFIFLLKISSVYSQSPCSFFVNAGNDTSLCAGSILQLNGSTTATPFVSVNWQPSVGLNNSSVLNPFASVTSTITYTLNVTALSELIYNGDFSAGDTGFTTGYIPGTGGISGTISNEGEYDINTNPHNSHIDFATFGDHTSGTGNMLIVNGSDNFNVPLWCQSIAVVPFSNYDFSAWLRTCNWQNPAIFQFTINGTAIAPNFYLTADTNTWVQFLQTWNSDTSSTAEICITDISTWSAGNDFAVDDISFTGLCTQTDSLTITVYPPTAPPVISQNGDTLFGTQGYSSYQWFLDSIAIPGAVNYYYVAQQSGNYYLMITDSNGCTAFSNLVNIITEVGETNASRQQIEIYPNPSSGNFTIHFSDPFKNAVIEITDFMGKQIYSEKIKFEEIKEVNISKKLSAGCYALMITSDQKTERKLILINR
jgi:type IX secretion system substrate protein